MLIIKDYSSVDVMWQLKWQHVCGVGAPMWTVKWKFYELREGVNSLLNGAGSVGVLDFELLIIFLILWCLRRKQDVLFLKSSTDFLLSFTLNMLMFLIWKFKIIHMSTCLIPLAKWYVLSLNGNLWEFIIQGAKKSNCLGNIVRLSSRERT